MMAIDNSFNPYYHPITHDFNHKGLNKKMHSKFANIATSALTIQSPLSIVVLDHGSTLESLK